MAGQDPVVVNSYPEQLPPGNPRQSLPPGDGGGKWVDPVLPEFLVDGNWQSAPRLRSNSRVKHGSVVQKSFKPSKGF